jgi:hypothetical protein
MRGVRAMRISSLTVKGRSSGNGLGDQGHDPCQGTPGVFCHGCPFDLKVPALNGVMADKIFNRVVFPEPLGPITMKNSPLGMEKETS